MTHLTEEQLVLHHYHDDEGSAARHLDGCPQCRGEYDQLRRVLSLVDELPVPEPGPAYGEEVWNRLRWKLGRRRGATWKSMLAAAALLAIAFFAGQLWHARSGAVAPRPSAGTAAVGGGPTVAANQDRGDSQRVLVLVVGDHLESSERMLQQIANADGGNVDMSERASELVVSNRMYRQTAVKQGDARIASLLADLEPILVELSHANKLSTEELKSLQKRIDSKGLLFKVRLVSAETSGRDLPAAPRKGTSSL